MVRRSSSDASTWRLKLAMGRTGMLPAAFAPAPPAPAIADPAPLCPAVSQWPSKSRGLGSTTRLVTAFLPVTALALALPSIETVRRICELDTSTTNRLPAALPTSSEVELDDRHMLEMGSRIAMMLDPFAAALPAASFAEAMRSVVGPAAEPKP